MAFSYPTVIFFRFGCRILFSTDIKNESKFGEYFGFAILMSVLGLTFVFGQIYVGPIWFELTGITGAGSYFSSPPEVGTATISSCKTQGLILILVALWLSLESLSECFAGLFQRCHHLEFLAYSQFLQSIVVCVGSFFVLWFGGGVIHVATCFVSGTAMRILICDLNFTKGLWKESHYITNSSAELTRIFSDLGRRPGFNFKRIFFILRLGMPLTIVTFLMAYSLSMPRGMIKNSLGFEDLGVFTALYALSAAPNLLVSSFAQAVATPLAQSYAANQPKIFISLLIKPLVMALLVSSCLLAVVYFFGEELILCIYGKEYVYSLPILMAFAVLNLFDAVGTVVGVATSSMRQFSIQLFIQCTRLLVVAAGLLYFLPRFGLIASGWVMVGGAAISVGCYALICFVKLYKPRDRHSNL